MLVSSGNHLKFWDSESGQVVNTISYKPTPIVCFSQNKDGSEIAAVVQNDTIEMINMHSGLVTNLKDTSNAKCCVYDVDGRRLMVGNSTGMLDLYDFKSNTATGRKKSIVAVNESSAAINSLSWSKNDRLVACGTSDGILVLFNTITSKFSKNMVSLTHRKQSLSSPCLDVSFSFFNPVNVASGYEDGTVVVWNTTKEVGHLEFFKAHDQACTGVVLSPINNTLAASGGIDAKLNIYDLNAKKVIKSVYPSKAISSLAIGRNGTSLCIGTLDGYLISYDLRLLNEPVNTCHAHDTVVNRVEYLKTSMDNLSSSSSSSNMPLTYSGNSDNKNNSALSLIEQTNIPPNNQHLSSNKFSTMSLYSPENAQNMSKTMTKSFSSSGLINPNHSHHSAHTHTPTYSSYNQFTGVDTVNYASTGIDKSGLGYQNPFDKTAVTLTVPEKTNGVKTTNNYIANRADFYSPINNSSNNSAITMQPLITPENHTRSQTSKEPFQDVKRSNNELIENGDDNENIGAVKKFANSIASSTTPQRIVEPEKQVMVGSESLERMLDKMFERMEKIEDRIEHHYEELMQQNLKCKMEMMKEIMALHEHIERSSVNAELVDEIMRLREENKRLKENNKLF